MGRLIRLLSLGHFRRHRLRTFLSFFGIVLGVAVMTAIAMVNRTLLSSFQETIDLVAGKAALQVVHGESGVLEALFPLARDAPGVKDATGSVEGFLPALGLPGERLYIYGPDLLADFAVRDYELVEGSFTAERALDFIANPDSIAITESLARRLRAGVGAKLPLVTAAGARSYTVRAILREKGAARAFGGNFVLMDLPVAQIALGKRGKLDVIDLTVEGGVPVESVRRRLEERFAGRAEVRRPRERGEQVEQLITSFRVGLFFVSLVALFVGVFLIYNTVSVSVVQRRREIGTLRCLGMLRRQVLLLFLIEAASLGTLGSAAGIAAGFLLAKGALAAALETVSTIFFYVDASQAALWPRDVLIAFASGVGVSLIAALQPAREAAAVAPVEGARQASWSPRRSRSRWGPAVGFGLLVVAPALWLVAPAGLGPVERFSLGMAAMFLFLLGLCFLSPAAVAWSVTARASRRTLPVSAALSLDSLARQPARAGVTASTLTISLAAIFIVAALVHSIRHSLLSWVDRMVTSDLVIHAGAGSAGPLNVPLEEELGHELKRIPGVRVVDWYRIVRSSYRGRPIVIESFAADASGEFRNPPMVAGDGRQALRRLAAGEGAIVSESFQSRFGVSAGDEIRLPTPSGLVPLRVLGVYIDYSSDQGSVLLDRALYKRLWHDGLADAIHLWLSPGAEPREVARRIYEEYGERYQLFISTHGELRETVVGIMEQSFRVNYAVEVVAVVVALFSVVNTLLASILDRSREIGVLRAIGATRRQIGGMVLAEAVVLGSLGALLGLFAGTVLSYFHVVYNTKVLTGWTFQYHYPYGVAVAAVAGALSLCALAACVPARRAAAAPVADAIGYE